MQKKNWITLLVFVCSIVSWITFDSLKRTVVFESGKELARYEAGEKSFLIEFAGLSKASEVVQSQDFNYGSIPQVELKKEEFLQKAPSEIIGVFRIDTTCGCLWESISRSLTVRMMFVSDGVMYFTSEKKELNLPKLSDFEKVEYEGEDNLRVYHKLNSSKISYGGWFTFFRLVSFIVFICSKGKKCGRSYF